MSATDHAKSLAALLKKLKLRYDIAEREHHPATAEFVYSFLLWEANATKARAAMKRITDTMVDFNELRVCRVPELTAILGKTYPRVEERALRLSTALNEVYLREYSVTLDPLAELSKREARQYLETLPGTPAYVVARTLLLAIGGHAVPVDDRLLARLLGAGAIEPGADIVRTGKFLERHIKASDAVEAHLRLQMWSEDPDTDIGVKPSRGKLAAGGAAQKKKKTASSVTKKTTKTTKKKAAKKTTRAR